MTRLFTMMLALCLTGCPIDPDCDPQEEDYDVDRVITQGDLDAEGDDCEDLCRFAYNDETGWFADTVEDCVLDVTPEPGADSATEVGTVTCAVHGFEYYCD